MSLIGSELIGRGLIESISILFSPMGNNTDVKKLFGNRLAEIRKEQGFSQESLALESGLARSYLGGVERGQRNIALMNICRLADTLNVSPAVLMDFKKTERKFID